MEERKELEKIGEVQVICGDGIFMEKESFLEMFGQILQIFYQMSSYLIVLADETCLF